MTEWLDRKYINIFSSHVRNFKWQNQNTARCSCPLCGDSQTNKFKARLYFITDNNKGYRIHCHNCGANMTLRGFLKVVNSELFEQYNRELIVEKFGRVEPEGQFNFTRPKFLQSGSPLNKLKRISQLPIDHPAKLYVEGRKIPSNMHYKLFFAPKFNEWTNSMIPNKLNADKDESRLVIPLLSETKEMFAYQGRALSETKIRYITIVLDESKPKIYGLDTVNYDKTFYVLEGPLDSLFLDNAIAMAGSDTGERFNNNAVFVFDNEPRNRDIVKKVEKAIEKNFSVVIWPESLIFKDINDMVMGGMTQHDVMSMIGANTYTHLQAKLKFTQWKKV